MIQSLLFSKLYYLNFFLNILQDKLYKMNKIIKEVYELSNTKDINIRYNVQSFILCNYNGLRNYNNRKYFVEYFLQITR